MLKHISPMNFFLNVFDRIENDEEQSKFSIFNKDKTYVRVFENKGRKELSSMFKDCSDEILEEVKALTEAEFYFIVIYPFGNFNKLKVLPDIYPDLETAKKVAKEIILLNEI